MHDDPDRTSPSRPLSCPRQKVEVSPTGSSLRESNQSYATFSTNDCSAPRVRSLATTTPPSSISCFARHRPNSTNRLESVNPFVPANPCAHLSVRNARNRRRSSDNRFVPKTHECARPGVRQPFRFQKHVFRRGDRVVGGRTVKRHVQQSRG